MSLLASKPRCENSRSVWKKPTPMKFSSPAQEPPTAEKVGSLIEQIECEVALLRQLHILSQTESLTLETRKAESLEEVVTQKEAIVAELSRLSECLTQKLKPGTAILARATFQERQALAFLKTEGVQLLHQIQRIDSNNRLRLEEFKTQSVESSHQLHQELRVHRAYDPSQPQTQARQFSELAD
jgi:flagellar biosynthesis/type III secretory pathway chaperone